MVDDGFALFVSLAFVPGRTLPCCTAFESVRLVFATDSALRSLSAPLPLLLLLVDELSWRTNHFI